MGRFIRLPCAAAPDDCLRVFTFDDEPSKLGVTVGENCTASSMALSRENAQKVARFLNEWLAEGKAA